MSKLHYALVGAITTITLYRGEKFSDEAKEILETVSFDADKCPESLKDGDIEKSLAGYGLLKLLQDRTSQDKGASEKLAAMKEYFEEFFSAGLWKKPAAERASTAGGSRRKITATLAEAIARIQGVTAIQAEAALKNVDKERFDSIVANERVVAMVAEVEKENEETVALDDL